jgi:hypothetical protein
MAWGWEWLPTKAFGSITGVDELQAQCHIKDGVGHGHEVDVVGALSTARPLVWGCAVLDAHGRAVHAAQVPLQLGEVPTTPTSCPCLKPC